MAMHSDVVVRAEGLGKQYHIGRQQVGKNSLRETLTNGFVLPIRRVGKLLRGQATGAADLDELIWALQDVSFEIKRGEVLGIIGRNGAGKSTLLKILSRITEPTEGFAEVQGRVGSLLEVGTGFQPELTGRENIYLNGAILGMQKREIDRKFDEIVDFSEIGKFLDTPVKHYSNGMYVRLAFAVAAHLESEIMIVDEVLAVGDMRFQGKCIKKMQQIAKKGHTVIFVSHNMAAIGRLCPRAILLDKGRVIQDGPSRQVVSTYLNSEIGLTSRREWPDLAKAPGNEVVRLRAVSIRVEDGLSADSVDVRKPIGIEMQYEVLTPGCVLLPVVGLVNEENVRICVVAGREPQWGQKPRPTGRYVSTAWFPGNLLAEGTLIASVAMITDNPFRIHFDENPAVAFQVIDTLLGGPLRGDYAEPGVIRPLLKWSTRFTANGSKVARE